MKIAFVRKAYTPYGGAERYVAQLVERLRGLGHEVHIFAHRWEVLPPFAGGIKGSAIFHRVPMVAAPSFLEALSFAFFSRRLLERENFDIIHSFERTLYQDVYRAGDGCHREWLLRRRKMEFWGKRFLHPMNPLHRSLLFLEKRLFQSARLKRIIANSARGKEEIQRHYRVPSEKIEVIHNGVDLEVFHPGNIARYRDSGRRELGIGKEDFVILFLGSGFRRKGLYPLLDSFARLKERIPKALVLVAGKDRVAPFQEKARRLGVGKKVSFLGPTRKAGELYALSDLFALPTFYDPFSNACLEAMATGIPVLTTSTNGVSEFITDGENGYLIQDPTQSQEMAEKILSFYHSPKRVAIGKKARESATRLDLGSVLERMLTVYDNLGK